MATPRGSTYTVASGGGVYAGIARPSAGGTAAGRTLSMLAALLAGGASAAAAPPPAPQAGQPQVELQSATSGTKQVTFGFSCRQGQFTGGIVATGGITQVTVRNRWPDASAKFVEVAGSYSSTGGVASTITLASGTASSGAALTTTDLQAALTQPVTVDAGAFGSASWSGSDWASPFVAWTTGHLMSSWIYRKPVGSDAHLVAWLEVRLYLGGAVEVLPWVENGYLNVAGPTNKNATYQFTLGGTARLGAGVSIDLKHHLRTPLINGPELSYWLATDPGVSVKHDSAYLMSTELVPTYSATVPPSSALITALPATYVPFQQGSFRFAFTPASPTTGFTNDDMATSGYGPPIGLLPQHDMLGLVSTANTYASVVRNGFSAGRYHLHYRDEATNRPIRFSDWPNLVLSQSSSGVKDVGASSANQYCPTPTGGNYAGWDVAHSPSVGFMAYLLTGRFYFMEQVQFTACLHFLMNTNTAPRRDGIKGLLQSQGGGWQARSTAWGLRTLAQAACITPDNDTLLRPEFVASMEANITHFYERYVAQANNPFGSMQMDVDYNTNPTRFAGSPWMQDFCIGAWGYAQAMQLPIGSTARSNMAAYFAWHAQFAVGRLGNTAAPDWDFRNAAVYTIIISPSKTPNFANGTGPWYSTWREMYDATALYGNVAAFGTTPNTLSAEIMPGADAMWGNLTPAVAYAVRFAVPGALAGWQRMTAAANYSALATQFNSIPVWGVAPATGLRPSWLQPVPVGQMAAIANSSPASYTDSTNGFTSSSNVLNAFSGFHVVKGRKLRLFGGGHNDYSGNEVLDLDLSANTPALTTFCAPTPVGSRVPAVVWQGTAPNAKMNVPHTYDGAIWSPALERSLWLGQSSPWNSGGGVAGGDRTFSLIEATGAWAQPGSGDDLGACPGGRSAARDTAGNIYTCSAQRIHKFTPGSGWSELVNSGLLNWNGFGVLLYDSLRNRLFRLGDLGAARYFTIECAGGAVANVAGLLTGSGADLTLLSDRTSIDSPGADYNPDLDAYVVPTGAANEFLLIDAGTWAVSRVVIPTVAGSVPNVAGYPSLGVFGRIKYVPDLGGMAYWPDGNSSCWFWRTKN